MRAVRKLIRAALTIAMMSVAASAVAQNVNEASRKAMLAAIEQDLEKTRAKLPIKIFNSIEVFDIRVERVNLVVSYRFFAADSDRSLIRQAAVLGKEPSETLVCNNAQTRKLIDNGIGLKMEYFGISKHKLAHFVIDKCSSELDASLLPKPGQSLLEWSVADTVRWLKSKGSVSYGEVSLIDVRADGLNLTAKYTLNKPKQNLDVKVIEARINKSVCSSTLLASILDQGVSVTYEIYSKDGRSFGAAILSRCPTI